MTIELYKLEYPICIKSTDWADIKSAMFFAKKTEIPPAFKLDVTPKGGTNHVELKTSVISDEEGCEDTVAAIEITIPADESGLDHDETKTIFLNRKYRFMAIGLPVKDENGNRTGKSNICSLILYTPYDELKIAG